MRDGKNLRYRFGEIVIDASNLRVSLRGKVRPLEPKSFRLLVFLLENPGRAVSKDEIIAAVWDGTAVSDNSLTRAITQIRKALDDDSKSPRYIQTVPTVGYRFAAECRVEEATPRTDRRRLWWAIGAALALAVGLGIYLVAIERHSAVGYPLHVTGVSKLTSYAGDEREPAVSPDGSLVAFSWSGPQADNYDIYVLRPGGEQPLRLTQDPAPDSYPAWSPDGSEIAFVRQQGQSAEILVVPPLGGNERVLHHFVRLGADLDFSQHPVLAWAPDGRTIVYSGLGSVGEKYRLYALQVDTGNVKPVSTPGADDVGDSSPAISADGKYLAFVRYLAPRNGRMMIQPLGPGITPTGEPFTVSEPGLAPRSPIWLEDGRELLFADSARIFEWNRSKGSTPIYETDGGGVGGASLGPRRIGGRQLVVAVERDDPDVYAIQLDANGMRTVGPAHVLARSTEDDHHPDYSPDGRLVTFVSGRSGSAEVWIANADGSNPRQLTHVGAHVASYPKWSPDGTKIAFHARVPDVAEVYVVDVKEGEALQITHENPGLALATWSGDGKYLYASTLVGGKGTTYRFPASGGPIERMWEGALLKESVDGKYVLYWKTNQAGIFRRSLAGDPRKNPEELLIPDFWPMGQLGGYAPVADGVYYVSPDERGRPGPFRFFRYATRKSVEVAPPVLGLGRGLAISPDGRTMAYVAGVYQGDLFALKLE